MITDLFAIAMSLLSIAMGLFTILLGDFIVAYGSFPNCIHDSVDHHKAVADVSLLAQNNCTNRTSALFQQFQSNDNSGVRQYLQCNFKFVSLTIHKLDRSMVGLENNMAFSSHVGASNGNFNAWIINFMSDGFDGM